MKVLAVVKVFSILDNGKEHHVSNLLIGKEHNTYTVWSNSNLDQLVFEKTQDVVEAAGTFNLWKKRYLKDNQVLKQYKEYPTEVEGYENQDHPFLKP